MSANEYMELIQDFCDTTGVASAGELLERGLLEVDGTLISVEYLEQRDEVRLLMALGSIGAEQEKEALFELLLEANLGHTMLCWPIFSLDPETGQPLVAYHVPLQALLDDVIDLTFVIEEQMLPLLSDWERTAREALASQQSVVDGGLLHATRA